jgi:hypothetical protein
MGFLVGFAVVNEKRFDGFLRRLLAVVNCNVVKGRLASRRAVSRSRHPLTIHAFASEAGRSAIEPPSTAQDGVFERGLEFLDAIHLLPRFHEHILGHPQSAQATMRALGTEDRRFVAMRHDDKEVNVTVVVRVAPGVRAIQPDLLGLKLRHEPLCGRLKQSVGEHFHDRFLTDGVGECKPRFSRAAL